MRSFLMSGVACLLLGQSAMAMPIVISSYTYDAPGHLPSNANSSYTDNGYHSGNTAPTPSELINGLLGIGGNTAFNDQQWVGIQDSSTDDGVFHPGLTFDLGIDYDLDSTTIHYLSSGVNGVLAPDSVAISFSDDGVLFTTPTIFTDFQDLANPSDPPLATSSTFSLAGNSGRYVRMNFLNDAEWTFLSEIQLVQSEPAGAPIPEPNSLVLLGLGAIAGLSRFRRRQASGLAFGN